MARSANHRSLDRWIGEVGAVGAARLKRLPDGRVIACAVSDRDSPPACAISVQFDRVWIERPDTREMLAQLGSG